MLFVITGPSGCGKSTLIKKVRRSLGDLEFSVSHTTRARRPSEKDGVDYHFVSERVFERMIREKRFLEHARVHGHLYGTSRAEIEKKGRRSRRRPRYRRPGRPPGAGQGPRGGPHLHHAARRRRAPPPPRGARDEDSPDAVERRLRNARAEVRAYAEFDFVVVNGDLGRAAADLKTVIAACPAPARRHGRGPEAHPEELREGPAMKQKDRPGRLVVHRHLQGLRDRPRLPEGRRSRSRSS